MYRSQCQSQLVAHSQCLDDAEMYNQILPVYCRENALESRFGNLRDKIRPKFAYVCNSLIVSLLVVNMAIVCRKSIC